MMRGKLCQDGRMSCVCSSEEPKWEDECDREMAVKLGG